MSGRPAHIVFGRHAVLAVLAHRPETVRALYLVDGRGAGPYAQLLSPTGLRPSAIDRKTLDSWCEGERHQDVAAAVAPFAYASLQAVRTAAAQGPALWLVVDQVQDPRNLGALIRSAVAFGASAVLLPKDRTAPLSGVALKASAGAAFALPLVQVPNLRRAMLTLKDDGVWIYGLAADGDTPVRQVDWRGPTAVVVGSEGDGLRALTRQTCDGLVSIPAGGMESLNAATAGAVALYEAACQRQNAMTRKDA